MIPKSGGWRVAFSRWRQNRHEGGVVEGKRNVIVGTPTAARRTVPDTERRNPVCPSRPTGFRRRTRLRGWADFPFAASSKGEARSTGCARSRVDSCRGWSFGHSRTPGCGPPAEHHACGALIFAVRALQICRPDGAAKGVPRPYFNATGPLACARPATGRAGRDGPKKVTAGRIVKS